MATPKEVVPARNCTWVTLPSGSDAVAWTVKVAGADKTAPEAGLVMLTTGGILAGGTPTVMLATMKGCTAQ